MQLDLLCPFLRRAEPDIMHKKANNNIDLQQSRPADQLLCSFLPQAVLGTVRRSGCHARSQHSACRSPAGSCGTPSWCPYTSLAPCTAETRSEGWQDLLILAPLSTWSTMNCRYSSACSACRAPRAQHLGVLTPAWHPVHQVFSW